MLIQALERVVLEDALALAIELHSRGAALPYLNCGALNEMIQEYAPHIGSAESFFSIYSSGDYANMWVRDPHSGGRPVPEALKLRITERILAHARKHYEGKYIRIEVRFRAQYCYIDAYQEPFVPADHDEKFYGETREQRIERMRNWPIHFCRLRFFGDEDRWTVAFFTYSHEKYEPSVFRDGSWEGTPEDAFDVGAMYLEP